MGKITHGAFAGRNNPIKAHFDANCFFMAARKVAPLSDSEMLRLQKEDFQAFTQAIILDHIFPSLILLAMSIEFSFKSILIYENTQLTEAELKSLLRGHGQGAGAGHNLDVLFKKLSVKSQYLVRSAFTLSDPEYYGMLSLCAQIFDKCRYQFESGNFKFKERDFLNKLAETTLSISSKIKRKEKGIDIFVLEN